ncbi:MAG: hypothetical protein GXY14_01720 [Spirochaetes bacterium]|nr:hypothetical protein [Spirochaetota bacterium]
MIRITATLRILPLLLLLAMPGSSALTGESDTMLFDYTVQNNKLPFGEYIMVRSFRGITQLLISTDVNKLYLYTDRDNTRPGHIVSSGFSRIDSIILQPPETDQFLFDSLVGQAITHGDPRRISTMPYPGLGRVLALLRSGDVRVVNDDSESLIIIKGAGGIAPFVLKYDAPWNKLTLRYDTSGPEYMPLIWQIYINESTDRNIKPLLRKFSADARRIKRAK